MWIADTRSRCSSAAMMLSTCFGFNTSMGRHMTLTGYGGQICSNVFVGVLSEQTTCRSRRRGDPWIIYRHLRHTCVNLFHLRVQYHSERESGAPGESSLQKANISRRALSGSRSIIPWPSPLDPSAIVANTALNTNFWGRFSQEFSWRRMDCSGSLITEH